MMENLRTCQQEARILDVRKRQIGFRQVDEKVPLPFGERPTDEILHDGDAHVEKTRCTPDRVLPVQCHVHIVGKQSRQLKTPSVQVLVSLSLRKDDKESYV